LKCFVLEVLRYYTKPAPFCQAHFKTAQSGAKRHAVVHCRPEATHSLEMRGEIFYNKVCCIYRNLFFSAAGRRPLLRMSKKEPLCATASLSKEPVKTI
jgi:hypothetical protein